MILTCPDCATRYFLHDVLVGRAGRTVKCTACGSTWRAQAEVEEPLPLEAAARTAAPSAAEPEPAAQTAFGRPAAKLSQSFRAQAQVQRKVREAAATGAIWAGLAAGIVVMATIAAVFRVDVVRLWPRTASAYAAVGLPVNPTGLVIEQVRAQAATAGGHPAVQVTGLMRNIVDRTVAVPPLRVSLLGKDGRPLARRLAGPPGPRIAPGGTQHFSVSLLDPPQGARDAEVTFALDALQPKADAARATPAPKLRGPAGPVVAAAPASAPIPAPAFAKPAPAKAAAEAKPLPAGSPYALPAIKPSVS